MSSFGERLRREREARGIDLDQVATATKVGRHHLEAIEREDFSELPEAVFARGFVQAYAQFVGLDPERTVAAFLEARREQVGTPEVSDTAIAEEISRVLDRRSGSASSGRPAWLPAVGVTLAIVALLVAGWLLLRDSQPAGERSMLDPRTPPPAQVEPPTQPAAQRDPLTIPPAVTTPEPTSVEVARAEPTAIEPEPIEVAPPEPAAVEPPAQVELPAIDTEPDLATIEIQQQGVGTGIRDRTLVGESDRFDEGTAVIYWTRVIGGASGDVIHHVWIHEGREMTRIELTLGGSHWRTHSRKTLWPGSAGSWTVEARDADGRVISSRSFDCRP